ncbi:MAG: NUDIX domain-containing protein [Patescibacteria group bacterium]
MKKQTTGVYLIKDNKMLFLVRKKKNDRMHRQGVYLPIGGHVELGEGIEEAAIREVQEEAGVTIHSVTLRGIVYIRSQNTGDYDNIIFLFTSSDFTGEPVAGREGSFEWVDMEKLNEANLYEGDQMYLPLLQKHDFFVVEFLYKGFELVEHKILKLV